MSSTSTAPALPTALPERSLTMRLQNAGRPAALIAAFAAVTYTTVYVTFLAPDESVDGRWCWYRGAFLSEEVEVRHVSKDGPLTEGHTGG